MAIPFFSMDDETRDQIKLLARSYLEEEMGRLEAAGLMPEADWDSPWIEQERLWRRRGPGRDAGQEFAKKLEGLLPTRWTGPAQYPGPAEIVEGLLRGYVAACTVETARFGPFGDAVAKPSDPANQIDEFVDLIEHPEQPWRVMRLLLDLDSRAVDGHLVHDVRLRRVRGLRETISSELPEGARRSEDVRARIARRTRSRQRSNSTARRRATSCWRSWPRRSRPRSGAAHGEIGLLEHAGRVSGIVRITPVHPIDTQDGVRIIMPLGSGSQWGQNVLAAGHCRLQRELVVLDLDTPQLVDPTMVEGVPWLPGRVMSWLGFRYLLLRRFAEHPGTLEALPPEDRLVTKPEPAQPTPVN